MSLVVESIGSRKIKFHEILLVDLLETAKIKDHFNEKKLTVSLNRIVGDDCLVEQLTVEERYAIFLRSLYLAKFHNLDKSIDIMDYLNLGGFNPNEVISENGVSVRHLFGVEAEALEVGCENTADWIMGEMALTIGCDYLPPIEVINDGRVLSTAFIANLIESRIKTLENLDIHEFNTLMGQYLELKSKQDHLINFVFDNGVVLRKINGGTEDAPVRFRATNAFYGYGQRLLSFANGRNS